MVLISHKHNFIYIKNVKTASSSVEHFFAKYCCPPGTIFRSNSNTVVIDELYTEYGLIGGGGIRKINPNDIFIGKHSQHVGIIEIKKKFPLEYKNYFKFCVVRNPYQRIVSRFLWDKKINEISKKMNFIDYIKKISKKKFNKINDDWYDRITNDGKPCCQYYIKFDNLKNDIQKVCEILNISDYDLNDLKIINKFQSYNYKNFFNEETKKIVYNNSIEEIKFFKYTF